MASNIVVQGLEARNEFGHVILTWSVVDPNVFTPGSTAMLDQVELWASTSPDMAGAAKVVEARNTAVHASVIEGVTYYYQARARDLAGAFGVFYPATYAVPCLIKYANSAAQDLQNFTLSASSAAGALTISLKTLAGTDPSPLNPIVASFRNTTADGSRDYRQQTAALAFTIPSGATFGLANNQPARVWHFFANNAGVLVMGSVVCSDLGGFISLTEDVLYTIAAVTAGSSATKTLYAASAITLKAIRLLGYTEFPTGMPGVAGGTWTLPVDAFTVALREGMKRPGDIVKAPLVAYSPTLATVIGGVGVPVLPIDNTAPQSNETTPLFSNAITPASPVNWIENDADVFVCPLCSPAAAAGVAICLFQDAVASAIETAYDASIPDGIVRKLTLNHRQQAALAGSTTFTLRGGQSVAGILQFNATLFNSTLFSRLRTTEFMG